MGRIGAAARAALLSAGLSVAALGVVAGMTTTGKADNSLGFINAVSEEASEVAAPPVSLASASIVPALGADIATSPPPQQAVPVLAGLSETIPPAVQDSAAVGPPALQDGVGGSPPAGLATAIITASSTDAAHPAGSGLDTSAYSGFSATTVGNALTSAGGSVRSADATPGNTSGPVLNPPGGIGRAQTAAAVPPTSPSPAISRPASATQPVMAINASGTGTGNGTGSGSGSSGIVPANTGSGGNPVSVTSIPPDSILDNGQAVSIPGPDGGATGNTNVTGTGTGSTGNTGGSGISTADPVGVPVTIPEPASLLVLLTGFGAALMARRHRA